MSEQVGVNRRTTGIVGGSMRIESFGHQSQVKGPIEVKLCIEGRNPVYAYADTVAQAIVSLARKPDLPPHVRKWLAPPLEEDDAKSCAELRRMIDLLLDRVEGRRG